MTSAREAVEAAIPEPFALFVRGKPQPQGSKRHVGGGVMIEAVKGLDAWCCDVRDALNLAWHEEPRDGAVVVTLSFQFLRPKSVTEKKRPYMTVRPDVDKLARAVMDAMTGVVLSDDARVVHLTAEKRYGFVAGVDISVRWL